jgi:hypothetical protein
MSIQLTVSHGQGAALEVMGDVQIARAKSASAPQEARKADSQKTFPLRIALCILLPSRIKLDTLGSGAKPSSLSAGGIVSLTA